MVNEALLVLIWAVDAIAILVVVWLLANDPGHRRQSRSESQIPTDSDHASGNPADSDHCATVN
jgi:hypothetical protein